MNRCAEEDLPKGAQPKSKREETKLRRFSMNLSRILVGAALATGLFGQGVLAQGFPNQPVRIVVPSAAGGGIDLMTRALAAMLSEKWDQPVLVENKSGANGLLGTAEVGQLPGDGYNLLTVTTGFVTNPTLYKSLPYDTLNDFTPITVVGTTPLVLMANRDALFDDAKSFVEYVKQNPGKVSYGSAGVGSGGHLMMERLMQVTDTRLNHIPYQGSGAGRVGLLSGEVPAMFGSVATAKQDVAEGALVAIGISSAERSAELPDVPTFRELGFPEFVVEHWYGLLGPAGIPPEVTQKIQATIDEIMADPALGGKIEALGFAIRSPVLSPDEFSELIVHDLDMWQSVITNAGIQGTN